jgi:tRNA-dihydrouridine synthase
MIDNFPFPKKSLFYAPMEGITDEPYRLALLKTFPEWDLFFTDFLRIPSEGNFTDKFIFEHFGETIFNHAPFRNKTAFQILANEKCLIPHACSQIEKLGFKHLDLNLGCPSKRVNQHLGGSYLLSDIKALKNIIKKIRSHYSHLFTVKMRIGYKDDNTFLDCIKLFEDEGVQAITIHARTRDQLYKGIADWSYIKQAVQATSLPIIGNGDIWTISDVKNIFEMTGCHSIMLGRGALKTPWMAKILKNKDLNDKESLFEMRKKWTPLYFQSLENEYRKKCPQEGFILKRFKSFSRNIFDDFPQNEQVKRKFMRSQSLQEFYDHLDPLCQ